jgi:hypothetical protein
MNCPVRLGRQRSDYALSELVHLPMNLIHFAAHRAGLMAERCADQRNSY